jgi:DNA-binding response OmpR family regulator
MASGGPTVLVVDDEPSLRLLCRVNLELDGFRVLEAGTLADARSALETEDVRVILLDVHVAGDDGGDLLDELRAAEASVCVAMLTGSADLGSARYAAADAVIAKPFDPVALVETVRRLADGTRVDSSA